MTVRETPPVDRLVIAILGGTGEQEHGLGLARRLAVAGLPVIVGSGNHDRAHAVAREVGYGDLLAGSAAEHADWVEELTAKPGLHQPRFQAAGHPHLTTICPERAGPCPLPLRAAHDGASAGRKAASMFTATWRFVDRLPGRLYDHLTDRGAPSGVTPAST